MNMKSEELKAPVITQAPPSLVEEILEETRVRGLLDLDRAAEQAQARVTALRVLMHAAIAATKPIHWILYKNPQGQVFARFNFAGAQRIAAVFGITVSPKGSVRIISDHGTRRTAEIFGTAHSAVLQTTFDNIRAYRVEGEDFLGRPSEDTTYKSGKTVPGVGDNDWMQSTLTALVAKGVRLVSGLVTVAPSELAAVWEVSEEEVIRQCGMGHGFSREERASAGQPAASNKVITEPQQKRMFALASKRLAALKAANPQMPTVPPRDIVREAIIAKAPDAAGEPAGVMMAEYDAVCAAIESWGGETEAR